MIRLTAIVLTYNEMKHILACLSTLEFADHRIVFDSGSTDDTQSIVQSHNAELLVREFDNYAGQRNAALKSVEGKTRWVLFVDADERVTPELAAEVQQIIEIDDQRIAGWQIPRHNMIFGRQTHATGWYPDYQTRLLRVGRAYYDPEILVHEVVLLDGQLGTCKQHFLHHNYEDISQFGKKQRRYTRYDAEILFREGVKPKPWSLLTMPLHQFRWRFITLKGYTDGWHGLRLSFLMARYEFMKYRFLAEFWRKGAPNL